MYKNQFKRLGISIAPKKWKKRKFEKAKEKVHNKRKEKIQEITPVKPNQIVLFTTNGVIISGYIVSVSLCETFSNTEKKGTTHKTAIVVGEYSKQKRPSLIVYDRQQQSAQILHTKRKLNGKHLKNWRCRFPFGSIWKDIFIARMINLDAVMHIETMIRLVFQHWSCYLCRHSRDLQHPIKNRCCSFYHNER